MANKSKILVTGASGHLGQMVLEDLKRKGIKDAIAMTRHPEKLSEFAKLGFDIRQGDFNDRESLIAAFKGAKRMLLISTDAVGQRVEQHRNAIEVAKNMGVKHIVYTSWPNAGKSKAVVSNEHLETEKMIMESGLSYTILRNYSYAENLIPSLSHALESGEFLGSAGDGKVAFITKHDCALAASSALIKESEESVVLDLSGAESFSYEEVAALAAKIKNKPIRYVDMKSDDYERELTRHGMTEDVAHMVRSFDDSYREGELSEVNNNFYKLVGHKPQKLKDFLSRQLR